MSTSSPSSSASPPIHNDELPTRERYKVMAFLGALSFLTYFDRVCISRAKEDIMASLDLNKQQIGWILGAFWAAYAIFEIPSGWLGDRFGARKTLTRIVLAWSLFTALSGMAAGFWSLLIYRFLFGAGEAGAYPNMARIQAHWLPTESRARVGGFIWLLARWGGAFSPMIFGAMLGWFGSETFRDTLASIPLIGGLAKWEPWRLAFWTAGLVGVVWCLAFYPWFRDDPAENRKVNRAELALINKGKTQPASHDMPKTLWRDLFTCPSLWAMGILYVSYSFAWSFFVSWVPDYFKEVHGQDYSRSEWQQGVALFFGGLSCLVGGVLCDWLVRKTGRKRLVRAAFPILGYGTACVCVYCMRFVETPEQATVLLAVAGAAGDFGQGSNWATIVDIGGRYAGTAAGFVNLVGNSGNAVQPVIGGWILEKFAADVRWKILFTLLSAMFLVATSMWLFINPNRKFYRETNGAEKNAGEVQ